MLWNKKLYDLLFKTGEESLEIIELSIALWLTYTYCRDEEDDKALKTAYAGLSLNERDKISKADDGIQDLKQTIAAQIIASPFKKKKKLEMRDRFVKLSRRDIESTNDLLAITIGYVERYNEFLPSYTLSSWDYDRKEPPLLDNEEIYR